MIGCSFLVSAASMFLLSLTCWWRLREMWQLFIQANPWRRARRPNVQGRMKTTWIVKGCKANRREIWHRFSRCEQGAAAVWAKASSCQGATRCTNAIGFWQARNFYGLCGNNHAGGKRRSTGLLAIATMAIQHCQWLAGTFVANGTACAAT